MRTVSPDSKALFGKTPLETLENQKEKHNRVATLLRAQAVVTLPAPLNFPTPFPLFRYQKIGGYREWCRFFCECFSRFCVRRGNTKKFSILYKPFIYFEGMTEAEYASKAKMTQSGISRRRKKTLSKLKKLLSIMGSIG